VKHLKLVILTALTILAVSAAAAATANAANPEFLGTLPNTFTSAGLGSSFLKSGALAVECGPSKGKGEVKGVKNAVFEELFENCKSTVLGVKVVCTGFHYSPTGTQITGETGRVLVAGTSTLGYELGTTNVLSILTVSPEIHFKCSSLAVNVKGCFAGKTTPRNTPTTKGQIVGPNTAIEDYTTDTGATASCVLLSQETGKTFTLATEIVTADLTFEKPIEIMA